MKIRKFLFEDDYYHTPGNQRWFSGSRNRVADANKFRFIKAIAESELTKETTNCVCGNDEFDIITTVDRHKIPQQMVLCTSCGLVLNNPRLDQKSYNHYYESGIFRSLDVDFNNVSKQTLNTGYYKALNDFLKRHDPDFSKRKSIFDVGANQGHTLKQFKLNGWEVAGVEPYQPACDIANSNGLNVQCDLIENFKTDKKFDVVYLTEVFEHLYDYEKALEIVRELLKDDGVLLIRNIGVLNKSFYDVYKFSQVAHPYNYCLDTLKMVVESNGFEFIAGDEFVIGLFRKGEFPEKKYIPNPNTYEAVKKEFRRKEQYATSFSLKILRFKVKIAHLLIRLGVYDEILKLKHKIVKPQSNLSNNF